MKKTVRAVAVTVALIAVFPAARAQQADPPKQSLTAKLKHKYLERRARFMNHVRDVYFAVGCRVLVAPVGLAEQSMVDLRNEEALRQAAMQEGLARAAKPGACDYYRRHPEAAVRIAAEAAKQK